MSNELNPAVPNAPIPEPSAPPKRPFWRQKRWQISALVLLCVVCWGIKIASFRDVALTVSPETTYYVEPLTPDGKAVDFRKRFETAQDDWLNPPRENGFRELLIALGPRILEQNAKAAAVRWEDFPTNPQTRDWFNGYWTKICAKFELDPTARPTFVDRPKLDEYLRADGTNAAEIDASPTDADALVARLQAAPWTADDCPNAARWLELNADVFDVCAKAIDAPKFGCPHFVEGETPSAWLGTLLPDVQACRKLAGILRIRANFRIGSGDVDGALDDKRSILRLSRHMLDNPNQTFVESLAAISIFGLGVETPVAGNPNARPTAEQLVRDAEIWRETFGEFDFDAAVRRSISGERLFNAGLLLEWAGAPASCKLEYLESLADVGPNEDEFALDVWTRHFRSTLAFRDFDSDAFARRHCKIWNAYDDATIDSIPKIEVLRQIVARKNGEKSDAAPAISRRARSREVADRILEIAIPKFDVLGRAFARFKCAANLATLQSAILRYQAENGTLPPAFTVDENGKPLQSWRVLILPYLGDAEKALYAQMRLDEPWDSRHNRQFWIQIPDVYNCPANVDLSLNFAFDKTKYSVIVGEKSLFDRSGTGKNLAELAKNPEKNALGQALIVERKTPVRWTRPDAELDENVAFASPRFDAADSQRWANASDGIASFHQKGVNVALADGSVRYFGDDTERAALEELVFGTRRPDESENREPQN